MVMVAVAVAVMVRVLESKKNNAEQLRSAQKKYGVKKMDNDKTKLVIDGIEYTRSDSILIDKIEESSGIYKYAIGKHVLVRSSNEGINLGKVVAAEEGAVFLVNVRRIWYHAPKDKTLSWYEGVSVSGITDDSKVSCTASYKLIVERYSLTFCSDEAVKSIMEKTPHAQN